MVNSRINQWQIVEDFTAKTLLPETSGIDSYLLILQKQV